MFGLVALVPVLGALSAAALTPAHMALFPRQIESAIPSACQSGCTQTLQIYQACQNKDYTTCLTVCNQDTFNGFVGCFDCVLENTPSASSSERSQLDSAISELKTACASGGQSVTGGLSGAASATGSGASSGLVGGAAGASFTSVASGITIAASASSAAAAGDTSATAVAGSAAAAASSVAASAGGVASSAAGAASSALAGATSAAASAAAPASGALPVVSIAGGLVALVGVAAGMAIAF
ncbi:uncharacterized protein IL334_000367 [Kwoniella shivajii]|uniref:Extracellular membrane protein CFEM domain-containing protein n=1 Tax=Kwoniella shivajii TaxID=564305 RepID=A0ABZ1CT61_9TREE|nr:hypothetical protein IL334_000367 [Kwoniella shivajii]